MSMVSMEKVTCPVCKKESEFAVWQSLNAQLDPEAVPQLLDGSLFRFTCPHCQNTATVEYDLLYHDMNNQAMIYYTQPMSRSSVREQLLQAEDAVTPNLSGHKKRIVTSREDLAEKIMIFSQGLDDRGVELVKLTVLARVRELIPNAGMRNIRFRAEGDKCYLDFLGEKRLSTELNRSLIEKLCLQFGFDGPGDTAENMFVDDCWAFEFLEAEKNKHQ